MAIARVRKVGMKNMLKISQVADRLNVSVSHVHNLVNSGQIRFLPVNEGKKRQRVRIAEEWIDDFIKSNSRVSTQGVQMKSKKRDRLRVERY